MRYWTQNGIKREKAKFEAAEKEAREAALEFGNQRRWGANSMSNGETSDSACIKSALNEKLRKLKEIAHFMSELQPAPTPRGNKICIDHKVTVFRHDTRAEMTFILGGQGEIDVESKVHTYSITSLIGRAVRGKRVGDKAVVDALDGTYDIVIKKIELPEPAIQSVPA